MTICQQMMNEKRTKCWTFLSPIVLLCLDFLCKILVTVSSILLKSVSEISYFENIGSQGC
jgi:hypothetical protein